MKMTIEDMEAIISELKEALAYIREARRVAKKAYGLEYKVTVQLKYGFEHVLRAERLMTGEKQ